MAPGQWVRLNVNGLTTALFVDGANNTLDYLDKGAHDPVYKQIRFIGQAHGGDQRFHQYDEMSNTWSNLADPPWDSGGNGYPGFLGHGYQHNAIDPATGDFYYQQYNGASIRRLRRSTGAWDTITSHPIDSITGGLEWLPTIGTQGGLILHLGQSCHRWDKASNTWSSPATNTLSGQGYHTVAVRSVPNNVVLLGGGNGSTRLWRIGATGGVTALANCPSDFGIGSSVTTVCPASGDLLVVRSSSDISRYSVNSNSWSSISFAGGPSFGSVNAGSKIVAIPIAAYGVIMFLFGGTPATWLYKHA
jgi:hypothetical protein